MHLNTLYFLFKKGRIVHAGTVYNIMPVKCRASINLKYAQKDHLETKFTIVKIAKSFDFCGFRLFYDKILLAKSFLDKFEKRLSMLYEQLLINKNCLYKK